MNKSTSRFRLEIAIALLIKATLLTLIWALFFSTPEANHMQMKPEQVSQHIVSANTERPNSTQPARNSK